MTPYTSMNNPDTHPGEFERIPDTEIIGPDGIFSVSGIWKKTSNPRLTAGDGGFTYYRRKTTKETMKENELIWRDIETDPPTNTETILLSDNPRGARNSHVHAWTGYKQRHQTCHLSPSGRTATHWAVIPIEVASIKEKPLIVKVGNKDEPVIFEEGFMKIGCQKVMADPATLRKIADKLEGK